GPGALITDVIDTPAAPSSLHPPDLVTVWLGLNELRQRITPQAYASELERLVTKLRGHGRSRVLVANLPPADALPGLTACVDMGNFYDRTCPVGPPPTDAALNKLVDSYDVAVRKVVGRTGAELVDLHAAWLQSRAAKQDRALVA